MFWKIGFFAFGFILLFRENELVNKKEIDVKKRYIRRKYVQECSLTSKICFAKVTTLEGRIIIEAEKYELENKSCVQLK